MTDILVTSPFRPFTLPTQFKAVFNGYIYCGTVDAVDPSVSQVQVYLVNESGDKVPVAQPLRTNAGGFLVYNGNPAKFVTDSNHSLLVRDSLGAQLWYAPDVGELDPDSLAAILSQPDGSQLVGFKGRNLYEKLSDVVSVLDHGADPTGATDSTTAFRAAYAEVKSRQSSNQATVFSYSTPQLLIPGGGKFLISGNIDEATGPSTSMQGINIVSDGGIIVGSGSFNLFNFRTNCSITGLTVHGCGRVFYIQSGNSDSAKFDIDRCIFQNQLIEAWGDDGASASSILNITRCKVYQVNGGADYPRIATMNIDFASLKNNWIYYGGVGSPFYTNCQLIDFEDNICVPNYLLSPNTQRSWFYNQRSLNITGNRFGAEGGGCTIVEHSGQYTTGESIVNVKSNLIYSSNSVPFKFYALPTEINIDENTGYDLSPGIVEFSTSIPVSDIQASMARGGINIGDMPSREYAFTGNRDVLRSISSSFDRRAILPLLTDVIFSANTDSSGSNRIASSSGSILHNYGDGRTGRKFTASGATSLISFSVNPAGISEIDSAVSTNEWFTVVFNITNQSLSAVSGTVTYGLKREAILIQPGDSFYCFSAPKLLGIDPNVNFAVRLQDGDQLTVGPLRAFKGVHSVNSMPMELKGDAAPTTQRWFTGDIIRNTAPIAGSNLFWVCAAGGTPGTWKTAGTIGA